jgi:hypothetical protein
MLPQDPSLAGLEPPDLGDKIDTKLIKPGKKIATTKLSAEQTTVIYEETIRDVIETCSEVDRATVMAALKTLPTTGLSPAEIKTALLAAVTKHRTDEHISKNEPGATPQRIEQVRQFFANDDAKWLGPKVSLALTEKMRPPEVVLADTNWGDAESQVQFVVVPDATSGELTMFKKDIFTGKLTPAGDNWANADYYEFTN